MQGMKAKDPRLPEVYDIPNVKYLDTPTIGEYGDIRFAVYLHRSGVAKKLFSDPSKRRWFWIVALPNIGYQVDGFGAVLRPFLPSLGMRLVQAPNR